MTNFYAPPSNHYAFHRYYRERQTHIIIPKYYEQVVIGEHSKNIKVLMTKYNVSIQTINISKHTEVEFILTHNRWLKLDDPENKIALCKNELYILYYNAQRKMTENDAHALTGIHSEYKTI
mgnify:CR=1 FL=1